MLPDPDGGYLLTGDFFPLDPPSTNGYLAIKIKEDNSTSSNWNMRYGSSGTDNFTVAIKSLFKY